ncbi:hypothetical protein FisN_25Lh165 [Fistulifera solaris]|uniref:Mitochondrial import inner membrane translocase subunit TIM50 n=1 Tax=Fistulifera solaris TaxID=1519565 RepID=A0A1Z5KRG3_FISSO|nr:hypothetical protein FisN_25Lh165 [Fistulifera solaris]|eukprot:GAX28777.1 hypothetical protein FisN_25Lh165 [Fistulifera solaris]
MLRNVILKAPLNLVGLQSSLFLHSGASVNVVSALQRACYSTSPNGNTTPRSSWVGKGDRKRGVCNSRPARRHVVNGRHIPLHVNDLHKANEGGRSYEKKKKYDSDLIVVLDMDECLIHAQFLSSPAHARVYAHQLQQQRRQQSRTNSTVSCPGAVDSFRVTLPDGDLVHVNVRPGLFEFLEAVTDRYETHIFTAALPIYADRVIDRLDPDGTRITGRWFRDSCTYDPLVGRGGGGGAYVKNLEKLPFDDLSRVVLVDNNPLSFLSHPENGILVNSFYTDPEDDALPQVLDLLNEIDEYPDVRPILAPRFGLEESLQQYLSSEKSRAFKCA